MKLYYASQACSISPHVALIESGLPYELVRVDFMRGKTTADGHTLAEVNPKGYVPALVLDDGELLTEGAVMVQYIADRAPASKLAPPNGTFERVRLQEWLNFIATELHKGMGPFFNPKANDDFKASVLEKLHSRLAYVEKSLGETGWITGDTFTVADGYMVYVLRSFVKVVKGDLSRYPKLTAYFARLEARPSVKAALAAEGLAPIAVPSAA